MSQNLISKYLFLEQKAQSLEEVLTFLTKAGGPIHIFSESTHIEALIKPCKMMKIKKKSYLYNPTPESIRSYGNIMKLDILSRIGNSMTEIQFVNTSENS